MVTVTRACTMPATRATTPATPTPPWTLAAGRGTVATIQVQGIAAGVPDLIYSIHHSCFHCLGSYAPLTPGGGGWNTGHKN